MYEYEILKIPDTLPNTEELNKLSFTRRGILLENIINSIFELNKNKKDGITIKELGQNLNFSKNALLRVLTKLVATRDIYCINGKPKRYFKNGRISHHFLNSTILLENQSFEFRLFANDFGKIKIFIQEKTRDLIAGSNYSGGIIIDADSYEEFLEALDNKMEIIQKEIKKFKNELKRLID